MRFKEGYWELENELRIIVIKRRKASPEKCLGVLNFYRNYKYSFQPFCFSFWLMIAILEINCLLWNFYFLKEE